MGFPLSLVSTVFHAPRSWAGAARLQEWRRRPSARATSWHSATRWTRRSALSAARAPTSWAAGGLIASISCLGAPWQRTWCVGCNAPPFSAGALTGAACATSGAATACGTRLGLLERERWVCVAVAGGNETRLTTSRGLQFLYPHLADSEAAAAAPQPHAPQLSGLVTRVDPGVETAEGSTATDRFAAAARSLASEAGAFYASVREWQAIPSAFSRLPALFQPVEDSSIPVVDRAKLVRWLAAELGRYLEEDDSTKLEQGVDRELVEFVSGLLELQDYCEPTLLALELHEFLGDKATSFVLALWKYLVVEAGVSLVFKCRACGDEKHPCAKDLLSTQSSLNDLISTKPASTPECTTRETAEDPQKPLSTVLEVQEYKRRRASYRGKVGTKSGREALRELIQKEMATLGHTGDISAVNAIPSPKRCQSGRVQGEDIRSVGNAWILYTDALQVRDMDRDCNIKHPVKAQHREIKSRGERRDRSRSRSRRRDKRPRSPHSRSRERRQRSRSSSPRSSRQQKSRSPASSYGDRGLMSYRRRRSRSRG